MTTETHSTYQIGAIILTLRSDLSFSFRPSKERALWVIEDERTSRFYRVGQTEYEFLCCLDGRTTLASAVGRVAGKTGDQAFTLDEAASFAQWLVELGLATTAGSRSVSRTLKKSQERNERESIVKQFGAISQKIPLLNPDNFLKPLTALLGGFFSGTALLLWLLTVAFAVGAVTVNQRQFWSMSADIVSPSNWLWLLSSWLLLKCVHELAHGVACQKFGGHVREAGVVFILFVPLPYVDVSSTWRIGSKWKRIAVSAAGMYAELFIGAVAALVWSRTDPGIVHQNAYNIMLSATLMTLAFNANPLMRFDGYYILSDWLGMPNLAANGQQRLSYWTGRIFLGLNTTCPQSADRRDWLYFSYGVAAFLWRLLVSVGLILAAESLLLGGGLVLSLIALISWWGLPIWRLMTQLWSGEVRQRYSHSRLAMTCLVVIAATGAVLHWGQWRSKIEAPAVVEFVPKTILRTSVSGFVEQVFVAPDEHVKAGQPLMLLRNDEIIASLAEVEARIKQSELQMNRYLSEGLSAAWLAEQERDVALRKRQSQLERERDSLTVVAPIDGTVIGETLESLSGAYVRRGEALVEIGAGDTKSVLVSAAQNDLPVFRRRVGYTVRFCVDGEPFRSIEGVVVDVSPRASRELLHPATGAHHGGSLAVRPVLGRDSTNGEPIYELVEPRFLVRISIPSVERERLRTGQTGMVHLPSDRRSIGSILFDEIQRRWWKRRVDVRESWASQ